MPVTSDQSELAEGRGLALGDLRSIRRALGKTQAEMARLLSVSTRAVQSYEQGWRPVPPRVRRMALFLLYVSRRRDGKAAPCWQVRRCSARDRACCAAYELGEGEFCWLVAGDRCPAAESALCGDRNARQVNCPVLAERLRVK